MYSSNNFEKITKTKRTNFVSTPRRKKTQARGGSHKRNWMEVR